MYLFCNVYFYLFSQSKYLKSFPAKQRKTFKNSIRLIRSYNSWYYIAEKHKHSERLLNKLYSNLFYNLHVLHDIVTNSFKSKLQMVPNCQAQPTIFQIPKHQQKDLFHLRFINPTSICLVHPRYWSMSGLISTTPLIRPIANST